MDNILSYTYVHFFGFGIIPKCSVHGYGSCKIAFCLLEHRIFIVFFIGEGITLER